MIILIFVTPWDAFTGYSYFTDFNTRISPNDALISTYYFWWTNLTYLPAFFFLFLTYAWILRLWHRLFTLNLLALTLFLVYLTEVIDFPTINVSWFTPDYGIYGINTLLTNTLNRYHPFVFYSSTLLLISTVCALCVDTVSIKAFSYSLTSPTLSFSSLQALSVNLLALWMGSWWALQEGTWGGWWNWDPSEIFGLVISVTVLLVIHSQSTLKSLPYLATKLVLSLLFFVFSYFFIQLNFDLVSHNFGSKFFFFFNNNLFFIEIVLATFSLSLATSSKVRKLNIRTKLRILIMKTNLDWTGTPIRLLVTSIITWWFVSSYRPLINYICWNFLGLNVLNLPLPLTMLNVLLLIVFIGLAQSISKPVNAATLMLGVFSSNWLSALPLLILIDTSVGVIHLIVVFLSLVNYTLAQLLLISWLPSSAYSLILAEDAILYPSATNLALDYVTVESSNTVLSTNGSTHVNWNLLTDYNSATINYFKLLATSTHLENLYELGCSYLSPTIKLELPGLANLNLLFLFLLIRLYNFASNKSARKPV